MNSVASISRAINISGNQRRYMQSGHIELRETLREWEDRVSDLQAPSSYRVSFTLIKVLHLNCDSGEMIRTDAHKNCNRAFTLSIFCKKNK